MKNTKPIAFTLLVELVYILKSSHVINTPLFMQSHHIRANPPA